MHNKLWFKAKKFGWGWYLSSWQGWLITLTYIILIILLALYLENYSKNIIPLEFIFPTIILTLIFIFISYKKGEKPRWRWG
jgi:hypothetical protein